MDEYIALADHLAKRRSGLLQAWREVVRGDPTLTTGSSMPRSELNDHIPLMLSAYERALREQGGRPQTARAADTPQGAEAHGLHRWQQGYDLRELTCELGRLNECMVAELDRYEKTAPGLTGGVMAGARRLWAEACTDAVSASVAQYYRLQQLEAAGHVLDLEAGLRDLHEIERHRAELWQQAAHDLRGNFGVVANATAGLALARGTASSQEAFLRLLQRNVASFHALLDDVTSLARLQAGREVRQVSSVDVAGALQELADALKPLAEQKGLYLRYAGPSPMIVEADAVKVRRLAQNLLLNAIKFTHVGGVLLEWGESDGDDGKRWAFTVEDTGSGLPASPGATIAGALEAATNLMDGSEPAESEAVVPTAASALNADSTGHRSARAGQGEGIGLSIVKRLCDLLDASVELSSSDTGGTVFRILLPRRYA